MGLTRYKIYDIMSNVDQTDQTHIFTINNVRLHYGFVLLF